MNNKAINKKNLRKLLDNNENFFSKLCFKLKVKKDIWLYSIKVYEKPEWFQKLWFKYIWKNNKFHFLLEINMYLCCPRDLKLKEFMNENNIHLIKNRQVAKGLSEKL